MNYKSIYSEDFINTKDPLFAKYATDYLINNEYYKQLIQNKCLNCIHKYTIEYYIRENVGNYYMRYTHAKNENEKLSIKQELLDAFSQSFKTISNYSILIREIIYRIEDKLLRHDVIQKPFLPTVA